MTTPGGDGFDDSSGVWQYSKARWHLIWLVHPDEC
jgi:hypothetical protein